MKTFFLLSLLTCSTPLFSQEVSIHFSPKGGVKQEVLSGLDQASDKVDVSMYSFSDSAIKRKLIEVAKRGVQVRLLLNKGQFKSPGYKCSMCETLEAAGVDVRRLNIVNHQKFTVIDDTNLLTGSGNWSSSADSKYDEDLISAKGKSQIVEEFSEEFEYLWQHSLSWGEDLYYVKNKGFSKTERSNPTAFFTSSNFKINRLNTFTLKNELKKSKGGDPLIGVAGKEIIRLIKSAKNSIKIATAHFRRIDMYDALLDAKARGVKVSVVTDQQEFSSAGYNCDNSNINMKRLDECLAKKGIDVKWKSYETNWYYRTAKQMHLKYIIVDDKEVLTGSYNYSLTAETSKVETLVFLRGEVVSKYVENFDKVFNYADSDYEELLEKAKNSDDLCFWKPVSLSFKQLKALRSNLNRNNCPNK